MTFTIALALDDLISLKRVKMKNKQNCQSSSTVLTLFEFSKSNFRVVIKKLEGERGQGVLKSIIRHNILQWWGHYWSSYEL